jgi:digeranylgeranylglycerophospholipid reductase
MPHESIDILVAGLGPAGARAAEAAAQAGKTVLAIEKKRSPGYPVQCAEFVPALLTQELGGLEPVTRQKIGRMVTFVDAGGPAVKPDFPGLMIDRQSFDEDLVQRAQDAGADCRFGIGLKELAADGTVRMSDGTAVAAKVVIGADGPRSRVGRAIGSVNHALVETRQMTVPLLIPHDATDIYLAADIPGGYAWLFPKGDTANLGIGVEAGAKRDLKVLLDELRRSLLDEGRIGDAILGYTGGVIPVGGIVGPYGALGDTHVLLAGDAAGLTNPVTGAGISAASISGALAGTAAASVVAGNQDAGEDYADDIDDLFGASLERARRRRAEILDYYVKGARPNAAALRKGWIAFPEYWAA